VRRLGSPAPLLAEGACFPNLREWYSARGITCLQSYAFTDLDSIAYESPAAEG
jgi:phenylacetate-CoA ligase